MSVNVRMSGHHGKLRIRRGDGPWEEIATEQLIKELGPELEKMSPAERRALHADIQRQITEQGITPNAAESLALAKFAHIADEPIKTRTIARTGLQALSAGFPIPRTAQIQALVTATSQPSFGLVNDDPPLMTPELHEKLVTDPSLAELTHAMIAEVSGDEQPLDHAQNLAKLEASGKLDGYSDEERQIIFDVTSTLSGLTSRQQTLVLENVKKQVGGDFKNLNTQDAAKWAKAGKAIIAEARMVSATNQHASALVDKMEADLRRFAREWHAPPGHPRSALNLELLAMNSIRFSKGLARVTSMHAITEHAVSKPEELKRLEIMAERDPIFLKVLSATSSFFGMFDDGAPEDAMTAFCDDWIAGAFARLEIGHKLAASLCLTDVPADMDVRAPWKAWSLVVPDRLLPPFEDGGPEWPARLWCHGTEIIFIVTNLGNMKMRFPTWDQTNPVYLAMCSLVRGACLALSNPEDFRKEKQHRPSARASKGRKTGPPEMEQARFLLSAPVKIDLREHLGNVLSGRKGSSPTVQFFVRGFWRNQTYGKANSLRRAQWIEGFWKGPEEGRILLRQHKVDE